MIKLMDDDYGVLPTLVMDQSQGFRVSSFEAGYPTVNEDNLQRVQANGTRDYTRFYGSSVVSMEALIVPPVGTSRQTLVDRLAQFCHPNARVYIHWSLNDDAGASRCMLIRGSKLSRPVQAWNRRSVQCQWVAPKGVQESSTKHTVTVPLSAGTGSISGRAYPLSYPRDYINVVLPVGATDVNNAGNEVAYPIIRIWGGITNPEIINSSYQVRTRFNLTIQPGSFLEIDTLAQTVYMNGDPFDSRYGSLDTALSTWWGLNPGINGVTLYATSSSGTNPRVEFIYRDAWI